eukprot:CAMPEP_0174829556 /NCGR_PEP_ID=MMETSP1114-20130205/1989_1 /TAXON_ID=312471 /ORGANISM="Neobodo designis, Strain CCAP 1951/1" /LENGTH=599 /DNA_ID=CAMNT_0016063309 /DNA_START=82 /DNA_END=1881 /DNA_ORIENTATION=+
MFTVTQGTDGQPSTNGGHCDIRPNDGGRFEWVLLRRRIGRTKCVRTRAEQAGNALSLSSLSLLSLFSNGARGGGAHVLRGGVDVVVVLRVGLRHHVGALGDAHELRDDAAVHGAHAEHQRHVHDHEDGDADGDGRHREADGDGEGGGGHEGHHGEHGPHEAVVEVRRPPALLHKAPRLLGGLDVRRAVDGDVRERVHVEVLEELLNQVEDAQQDARGEAVARLVQRGAHKVVDGLDDGDDERPEADAAEGRRQRPLRARGGGPGRHRGLTEEVPRGDDAARGDVGHVGAHLRRPQEGDEHAEHGRRDPPRHRRPVVVRVADLGEDGSAHEDPHGEVHGAREEAGEAGDKRAVVARDERDARAQQHGGEGDAAADEVQPHRVERRDEAPDDAHHDVPPREGPRGEGGVDDDDEHVGDDDELLREGAHRREDEAGNQQRQPEAERQPLAHRVQVVARVVGDVQGAVVEVAGVAGREATREHHDEGEEDEGPHVAVPGADEALGGGVVAALVQRHADLDLLALQPRRGEGALVVRDDAERLVLAVAADVPVRLRVAARGRVVVVMMVVVGAVVAVLRRAVDVPLLVHFRRSRKAGWDAHWTQ